MRVRRVKGGKTTGKKGLQTFFDRKGRGDKGTRRRGKGEWARLDLAMISW